MFTKEPRITDCIFFSSSLGYLIISYFLSFHCCVQYCLLDRKEPGYQSDIFGLSQNYWGFPGGSDGKASAWNAGDLGLIPGLGRSPGEGNGHSSKNPLQHSCLENSMDGGAWQAPVYGITKSWMQLSNFTGYYIRIIEFFLFSWGKVGYWVLIDKPSFGFKWKINSRMVFSDNWRIE